MATFSGLRILYPRDYTMDLDRRLRKEPSLNGEQVREHRHQIVGMWTPFFTPSFLLDVWESYLGRGTRWRNVGFVGKR